MNIFDSLKNHQFDLSEFNPTSVWFNFNSKHTEETKKLISESKMGIKQTPEHIQKRVNKMVGFKQSDYQKNRMKECLSEHWTLTDPNGIIHNITNLRQFCRENKLDQGNMVKVSQGILKQSKGWTCVKNTS
jgi:hypothetical protein